MVRGNSTPSSYPKAQANQRLLTVRLVAVVSDSLWTVARQAPLSVGILQARILEWVAMPSSRGSSQPRDRTQVSALQADSLPAELPGKPTYH